MIHRHVTKLSKKGDRIRTICHNGKYIKYVIKSLCNRSYDIAANHDDIYHSMQFMGSGILRTPELSSPAEYIYYQDEQALPKSVQNPFSKVENFLNISRKSVLFY